MTELEYFFEDENGLSVVYQLISFGVGEPWKIVRDGELIGSMKKWKGTWKLQSGDELSDDLLIGLTSHIDAQHFNCLPGEISSRWPNLVEKVVLRSDTAYMIICKEGINLNSFQAIFSRFVPGLLKDEWAINFQVFNHDFSDDFSLLAKPLVYKKESFGWEEVDR
ncbi:hypothetical protein [uncultured Pedobacter sp.]|uniref:hypothetical protein n=1 Tax=uncultured Pedobacter sp. TaxID=246139 RepID=UPI0025CC1B85|nr:hypothetical protein [uncultured Pedobacter sp.]